MAIQLKGFKCEAQKLTGNLTTTIQREVKMIILTFLGNKARWWCWSQP